MCVLNFQIENLYLIEHKCVIENNTLRGFKEDKHTKSLKKKIL